MQVVGHMINGSQFQGQGDRTQDVFNPATGAVTKQVALASKNTVEEAIAAAQAAFPAWRNTPPMKRARVMFRFKQLLEEKNMTNELNFFTKHSKKDDLADCFLQGIYYLNNI